MIIKIHRKAGESTFAVPLNICQNAADRIEMWRRVPVEQMQQELKEEIEQLDRWEYLVTDDMGTLIAMMVIDTDKNPHYGSYLYPRYAIATENNLLSAGYQWMKQLAKSLNHNGFLITRTTGDYEITHRFKRLKHD